MNKKLTALEQINEQNKILNEIKQQNLENVKENELVRQQNEIIRTQNEISRIQSEEERNKKLDKKINDFNQQLEGMATKNELAIERNRINNLATLSEGSTTGDAELIDGRVGANGVTYSNIGSAIRSQFKKVNKISDYMLRSYNPVIEDLDITILDNWIEVSGASSDYNNWKHIEISNLKENDVFILKCRVGINLRAYVIKNSDGVVTRVYDREDYGLRHDYDVKVTINSDEEGGTLYVNTFDPNYLGVKTESGLVIDSNHLANKNIFMNSNLYGKKIIFFGDSITANPGSWGDVGTIRAKYNMAGENFAVGGMTYTVRADSHDTNNIYLRMRSKLSNILDADYICFQGATNDAFRGLPIGEMLDENDFTTEADTSTFAGAFEMACRLLRTQVPGAKLLYITNIKIPRNRNLVNYVNMAKRICNKYSIKYLDLWNDSGMCSAIQSFNDKYYSIDSSVSTEHGDQTHPTVEAYRVHLNDKVDFALNSL